MSTVYLHEDFLWSLFARRNPALRPRRKAQTAGKWARVATHLTAYLRRAGHVGEPTLDDLLRWAGEEVLHAGSAILPPPGYEPLGIGSRRRHAADHGGVEGQALIRLAHLLVDCYFFHGQRAVPDDGHAGIGRSDVHTRTPYAVPTRRQYDAWHAVFPLTASGAEGMEAEWQLVYPHGAYGVLLIADADFHPLPRSFGLADLGDGAEVLFAGRRWIAEYVGRAADGSEDHVALTLHQDAWPADPAAVREAVQALTDVLRCEIAAHINAYGDAADRLPHEEYRVTPQCGESSRPLILADRLAVVQREEYEAVAGSLCTWAELAELAGLPGRDDLTVLDLAVASLRAAATRKPEHNSAIQEAIDAAAMAAQPVEVIA